MTENVLWAVYKIKNKFENIFFFFFCSNHTARTQREQVRNEVQQVWAPINKLRCVIYGRLVAIMTGRNKKLLGRLFYII